MTECTLGAVHLWDNPPPPFQCSPLILSSAQDSISPPVGASSPPRGEGVRGAEGDPHFWLLDNIQVLTRDSDDSASTAEDSRQTEKKHGVSDHKLHVRIKNLTS